MKAAWQNIAPIRRSEARGGVGKCIHLNIDSKLAIWGVVLRKQYLQIAGDLVPCMAYWIDVQWVPVLELTVRDVDTSSSDSES